MTWEAEADGRVFQWRMGTSTLRTSKSFRRTQCFTVLDRDSGDSSTLVQAAEFNEQFQHLLNVVGKQITTETSTL